ncbi:unnamed protein product [Ixodes hexagonus]
MWAAENYAPGLIAISESAGEDPSQNQPPKCRRLCRYLGVLAFLSILGIGLCFAIALTVAQPPGYASWEYLLISSPIVIPGLLALYLCTRRCCGLILNLVFAFLALLCGAVLVATETLAAIGIMLTIVGGLILSVILVTLVYDRITGRSYYDDEDDGELGSSRNRSLRRRAGDLLFGDDVSQRAYPNCAPLRRSFRLASQKKKNPPASVTEVQFIVPELPPPSSELHSRRTSPERLVPLQSGDLHVAMLDGIPRDHHGASVASTSGPVRCSHEGASCRHSPSRESQLTADS